MQELDHCRGAEVQGRGKLKPPAWPMRLGLVKTWPFPALSRQSKRLLQMSVVLICVMVIAIIGTIWHMRYIALRDAEKEATNLGVVISEQTARAVQAADLVLQRLKAKAASGGVTTPEAFRAFFATEAVHKDLYRQNDELPQTSAFTIVGADGNLINYSRQWPVVPTNLADRNYYKHFRNQNDTGIVVTEPMHNRGDGKLTFYLIRRFSGPDGQFLGLVLAALDLGYFQDFYAQIANGDTSISLIRADGMVLTRYPPFPAEVVKVPKGAPWYASAAKGRGLYQSPGLFNEPKRTMSVHALADYPIVITIGISLNEILAPWRQEAALIGGGTLCAILCVVLLLRALTTQLHRLEQSEASLGQQNETLLQAQECMREQAAVLSINQTELAEKTTILETTLDTMDQGLLTVNAEGRVTIYNRRVQELLDLPPALLANTPPFADLIAYQRAMGEFDVPGQVIPAFVSSGQVSDQPYRYERIRPNGRAIEVHSIPMGAGMVRTFTDISDRRRSEEQVRYLARHDSLTKLVNRMTFQERLQQAIDGADRNDGSLAVLCLDLDRFKLVNDTRGHAAGDKLLAEVSARLRSVVRETDTVARMGGDEFAVLQPFVEQPHHAQSLAARLLDLISRPYEIDGSPALIGVSIGIAIYPAHGRDSGTLLRNADTALYRSKADGRGVCRLFDESMEAAQRNTFQLEQDLRQAWTRNELDLAYQPIVDVGSRTVLAYEALLRWNHPVRGPISPAEFIPLAEMSGAIVPIGIWVLETACAEAVSWPAEIRVSVNLSPLQFRQGNLVTLVKGVLARTGLAPDRLSLEVTEGLLLDGTCQVLGMMEELRHLGVRFSLDDFGTAHAGLSYLRCFPFDAIKIDKSFVQDAVDQIESRAIVKTILVMANVLKLNVIAEGVETEAQFKLLRQMRCRQIQGYLTGRPVPASVLREQWRPLEPAAVKQWAVAEA